MSVLLLFSVKSILVSGLLTSWYWVALRGKRLHAYNRLFLLFVLYASIQLPLLHLHWPAGASQPLAAFAKPAALLNVISDATPHATTQATTVTGTSFDWPLAVFILVVLVSLALLTLLIIRVSTLIRWRWKYATHKMNGITIVHTDLPQAPFSFFNSLYWKEDLQWDTEESQLIVAHEMAHIHQKHSYDKLACQVLTCIFWFNPFYWIIQKELGMIHEFTADEAAITDNDTDSFARMLLQAHYHNTYLVPEHPFFSSSIKRRLSMLQTSKNTKLSALRRVMALPLSAFAVVAFSFAPPEAKNVAKAGKKIILVLDPGHGGREDGAHIGDVKEKDLNLKIAQRLSQLSPQYNIEAHLTRTGDEGPTLAQRVEISNKWHADDFISVHVADDPNGVTNTGDYDVSVCMESPSLDKSKQLGWAVYEHMKEEGKMLKQKPTEKRLYVLRYNHAPSILIEFGDIKNKEEMAALSDDAKLEAMCRTVLSAVVEANKN